MGTISRDTLFSAQEKEVNDIRWFSIDEALENTHQRMQMLLDKVQS